LGTGVPIAGGACQGEVDARRRDGGTGPSRAAQLPFIRSAQLRTWLIAAEKG